MGGLEKRIYINKTSLEKIDYGSAMAILKAYEEKAASIKDPTAWVQNACNKIPDHKIRTTLAWYNNHGNLQTPIVYDDVKEALAAIHTKEALRILNELEDKQAEIRD